MGITSRQRGKQIGPGMASWVDVPFDPANFYTGAMTWTINAPPLTNQYCRIGNMVVWNMFVSNSTIGGTPGLQLACKAPVKARYSVGVAGSANTGGDWSVLACRINNPDYFAITKMPLTNFAVGALQVLWSITYEVAP